MMKARNLRALRSDDRAIVEAPATPTAPTQSEEEPPESVDLVTFDDGGGGELRAISGWDTAMRYWSNVATEDYPDLIVGDVLFDHDRSTPLNWGASDTSVPTGLSHLKPFAAVARTAGRPLGLGIQTGNPRIWERIHASGANMRMAALAAHEIGEVAAILGDDELVAEIEELMSSSGPHAGSAHADVLEACWRWLERRSAYAFTGALNIAVCDYRRLLSEPTGAGTSGPRLRSFVLPADWVHLMSWCDAMKGKPATLRENDIGVPFWGWTGEPTCVWLSSLFADVERILDADLPAGCFEIPASPAGAATSSGHRPWELDSDNRPQIGAFLASLGSLGRAFDEAAKVVGTFVVRPTKPGHVPRHLRDVVPDEGHGPLVRGLVVLFQWIRREFENDRLWQEAYKTNDWNRRDLCFGTGTGKTLDFWLGRLQSLVRGRTDWFYRADPFDEGNWDPAGERGFDADAAWVRWHFDRLVDLGVLEYEQANDLYRWVRKSKEVPRAPSPPPAGEDWVGPDPKKYLRDALGFGAAFGPMGNNDHAIGQIVQAAFWQPNEEQGRVFVDRFMEGNAPPWLVEVCKEFAKGSLGWTDERAWPRCLRAS